MDHDHGRADDRSDHVKKEVACGQCQYWLPKMAFDKAQLKRINSDEAPLCCCCILEEDHLDPAMRRRQDSYLYYYHHEIIETLSST